MQTAKPTPEVKHATCPVCKTDYNSVDESHEYQRVSAELSRDRDALENRATKLEAALREIAETEIAVHDLTKEVVAMRNVALNAIGA